MSGIYQHLQWSKMEFYMADQNTIHSYLCIYVPYYQVKWYPSNCPPDSIIDDNFKAAFTFDLKI